MKCVHTDLLTPCSGKTSMLVISQTNSSPCEPPVTGANIHGPGIVFLFLFLSQPSHLSWSQHTMQSINSPWLGSGPSRQSLSDPGPTPYPCSSLWSLEPWLGHPIHILCLMAPELALCPSAPLLLHSTLSPLIFPKPSRPGPVQPHSPAGILHAGLPVR